MNACYGMWVHALAGRSVNAWVRVYSLDAWDGLGAVEFTADPAEAVHFLSVSDVLTAWKTVSPKRPLRLDGRPNRPLSALTISPEPLPEGANHVQPIQDQRA